MDSVGLMASSLLYLIVKIVSLNGNLRSMTRGLNGTAIPELPALRATKVNPTIALRTE